MRLHFPFSRTMNTWSIMRRLGYSPDRRTGFPASRTAVPEASYQRRLGRMIYPRFHVYINQDTPELLVMNLHVDMKKASYAGSHAHSGEYEGPLVEEEAARIEAFVLGPQKTGK